jgi:acyl-coenzyme A thioesterase PaaI-like protein
MLLPGSRPGFNHALKLSHQTMDPKRIQSIGTTSDPELTYRYSLSPDIPKYSTGIFTALMDELSTDACFRVGLPSPPGLSLQFQTELVDVSRAVEFFANLSGCHDEVDIINTVSKLGRTIAHTRTDFRCSTTSRLIAFSSHVKYMPTGLVWLDLLLRNSKIHDFYIDYALRHTNIPVYEGKALATVISEHLDFPSATASTFTCTTEHTNPFGAMHGGCQAILMERVALEFVQAKLADAGHQHQQLIVEAMQVEFLSAGQQGPLVVVCESIGESYENGNRKGMHVRVQLRIKKNNRLCSEGKLRISTV